MRLIFIRHSETEYNKKRLLQGSEVNLPLTQEGIKQAQSFAKKLNDVTFDVVFCSPLARTRQTAEIILKDSNKQLILDDRLEERAFGTLTGQPDSQIQEHDYSQHYDYRPYGGESVEDVRGRLESFINDIKNNHKDNIVLVVTHAGIIRLMAHLYGNKKLGHISQSQTYEFNL